MPEFALYNRDDHRKADVIEASTAEDALDRYARHRFYAVPVPKVEPVELCCPHCKEALGDFTVREAVWNARCFLAGVSDTNMVTCIEREELEYEDGQVNGLSRHVVCGSCHAQIDDDALEQSLLDLADAAVE